MLHVGPYVVPVAAVLVSVFPFLAVLYTAIYYGIGKHDIVNIVFYYFSLGRKISLLHIVLLLFVIHLSSASAVLPSLALLGLNCGLYYLTKTFLPFIM